MDKGRNVLRWLRRGGWTVVLAALAVAAIEFAASSGTHAGTGATAPATQERTATGVQPEGCPTLSEWNREWERDPGSLGTEGPIYLR